MSAAASQPIRAALWMTGAIASFSLMAIGGREVVGILSTFELMLFRAAVGAVLITGFAVWTARTAEFATRRFAQHVGRNAFHYTAQNLWFYAVAIIPLAQLFAIEFTTPIWIALLAPFFLGERLTAWRIFAAGLGFTGILIVARPGIEPVNIGHLAAALSSLGFCGAIMMTKALSRTDSALCILFWMNVIQLGFGIPIVFWDGAMTVPDGDILPWVALVSLCGLSAQICLTTALTLAPASVVAPMDFARLPVIAIVGWLAYSEALEAAVIVGAALILTANMVNLRAEHRSAARFAQETTP